MRTIGYAFAVAIALAAPVTGDAQSYGPQDQQPYPGTGQPNRQSRGSFGQPMQGGPAIRDVPNVIRPPEQLFIPQNQFQQRTEPRQYERYEGRGREGWERPYGQRERSDPRGPYQNNRN